MQALESATANARLLRARRGYSAVIFPDAEAGPIADRPSARVTEAHSASVQIEHSPGQFTAAEVRNMQRDDAMAAGMIGVVLGLAFTVLLSLTICVNIWMQSVPK